jgi:hypothetical protein
MKEIFFQEKDISFKSGLSQIIGRKVAYKGKAPCLSTGPCGSRLLASFRRRRP